MTSCLVVGAIMGFAVSTQAWDSRSPRKARGSSASRSWSLSARSSERRHAAAPCRRGGAATITELDRDGYLVATREAQQVILESFNVKTEDYCNAVENCEVKAAQMMRARYLLSGRATKIGSTLTLTIKLFDAEVGRGLFLAGGGAFSLAFAWFLWPWPA